MKKGIIYTIIFTLVISFAFVFILSCAYMLTKEITENNAERAVQRAVLKAFNISYKNDGMVSSLFNKTISIVRVMDHELYAYEKNGITGYGINFYGNALWGRVSGILAVNNDVTMIIGIEFINHNETPGLGGRIDEDIYKDQFRGEILDSEGKISGTRLGQYDYDHQNSIVDGITGATRTSESVIAIVNNELSRLRTLLGELR